MITIKLDHDRYVVLAMLNKAHTGGDNRVITTPTGDRVNCVLDSITIGGLEVALAAGDIYYDSIGGEPE